MFAETAKEVPFLLLSLVGTVGIIVLGRLWWVLRSGDQLRKNARAELSRQKFDALHDEAALRDINSKIADTLR